MKAGWRIVCAVGAALSLSLVGTAQGSVTGKKGDGGQGSPPAGSKGAPTRGEAPPRKQDLGKGGGVRPLSGSAELTVKGRGASRSGSVNYGSVHNQAGRARAQGTVIADAPLVASNRGIVIDAHREDRVRRADEGYRSGYWFYDPRWTDDCFWYPYYGFVWSDGRCVPSPFYFYGHLPPYIQIVRVGLGSFSYFHCAGPCGGKRDWHGRDRADRDRDLDEAVRGIEDSFRHRRMRSLSNVAPERGTVLIELESQGRYQISADDFYDLLRDAVETTRTVSYDIERVCIDGDRATVVGRHRFIEPWGGVAVQWHTYGLERHWRGFEIRFFKTSRRA